MTDVQTTYHQILTWCEQFQAKHPPTLINGDVYDVKGDAYGQSRMPMGDGRLEVNLVLPEAANEFEWAAEITIDHGKGQGYQHILLQTNGQVVETYGKQVIAKDVAEAEAILEKLRRLST